jgi:hypothetical protein
MSARKSSRTTEWPGATPVQPQPPSQPPAQPAVKPLVLEPGAVSVSKNGIEFRSHQPIPNVISLLFSGLTPHAARQLGHLARDSARL